MTVAPQQDQTRCQVAFIDDDSLMRAAFRLVIPGVDVVMVTDRVDELLRDVPPGEVDVVVLDLNLDGIRSQPMPLHGARAVRLLAALGYPVLIYTNESRSQVLAGCLGAGARGLIHKAEPVEKLVDAIGIVCRGGMVVTTGVAGLAEAARSRGLLVGLSPRQLQVLNGRARGESFQSIADRLFITRRTAEDYMSAVTSKFADYLMAHSPADLERELGVGPGDLLS